MTADASEAPAIAARLEGWATLHSGDPRQLALAAEAASHIKAQAAEIAKLRRIPAHYGAPADDADAAIRWITGLMDDEARHLREDNARLRAALDEAAIEHTGCHFRCVLCGAATPDVGGVPLAHKPDCALAPQGPRP
ncbi:MAG: hypothetical protein K2X46_14190 [Roseomonas sp.]|nr:hypothetical protein [Roseomonas sp.]